MTIKAILTDIEGTTSSIAFVHDILFPYASNALPEFVAEHQDEDAIAAILDDVRREADVAEASVEAVIEILQGWIATDQKVTALKTLQGHIWKHGYENGDFTGHIYADAADNLRQWAVAGIELYVYSSGSVGAQKLLFGHSDAGDLQPLFRGYFDTETGHKKEQSSYETIVRKLKVPAQQVLFLSDIAAELDAAASAGMQTVQLVRDDDVVPGTHPIAKDFAEVTQRIDSQRPPDEGSLK